MSDSTRKEPRYARMKQVCRQFPSSSYANMDNNRLAVYAINLLDENGIPRTQEALAVAVFLMFPDKFSMVGFPQYPDIERVNRTLLQLAPKYRNWATGNRHVGYTLTETGYSVLRQTNQLLQRPELQPSKKRTPKERTRDPMTEVKEIERSLLFQGFTKKENINSKEYAFWQLLQAFPYTPKQALEDRFRSMKEAARLAGRKDVMVFLDWVHKTYSALFREEP